jgi:NRAMP (natural resistance-associated macrophage protein)-like metal ion transporter
LSETPLDAVIEGLAQGPCPTTKSRRVTFLRLLGPGLVTGASDDDPSGIATYSKTGAQFGYGMLWVMLFSYPLMCAIQEISARIGRVTGRGIAANMRANSHPIVRYGIVVLLCLANVLNLGADFGAMGAAARLVLGGPATVYVIVFVLISVGLQVFVCYTTFVKYLKWLTVVVFAYVFAAFVVHIPWAHAFRATVVPSIQLSRDFFATLTAVLGTTISPYLFFWQASQEAEEVSVNPDEHPLKRSAACEKNSRWRVAPMLRARSSRRAIQSGSNRHLRRDGNLEPRGVFHHPYDGGDSAPSWHLEY